MFTEDTRVFIDLVTLIWLANPPLKEDKSSICLQVLFSFTSLP